MDKEYCAWFSFWDLLRIGWIIGIVLLLILGCIVFGWLKSCDDCIVGVGKNRVMRKENIYDRIIRDNFIDSWNMVGC